MSQEFNPKDDDQGWCSLIDYDENGEHKILASSLYRFGGMSYADALAYVVGLDVAQREEITQRVLGGRGIESPTSSPTRAPGWRSRTPGTSPCSPAR